MSSATIGSLNVTVNGDFNYCMIHCFLNNVSMCYPLLFTFILCEKKINMPRNVNFFMVLQSSNRSIYFFADRLFTCYHLSIHYVLSNQSTLELVMKAENFKGNKILAVIEHINRTRSKIGRTAQKKETYPLKLQIMTRSVKRNQKIQLGGGGGGGRGTLGISGWGCAAGTLEPLTYNRASSAKFCYPRLEYKPPQIPPILE